MGSSGSSEKVNPGDSNKGTGDTTQDFGRLKRGLERQAVRRWTKMRREILLDLACLTKDSVGHFRKRFPALDVCVRGDAAAILEFRDQLRAVWTGEVGEGDAMGFWEAKIRQNAAQSWVVSAWADGSYSLHPNYQMLALSLAFGVGELRQRMAVCANPDCPQRYFLKGRKSQRFCDCLTCASYGQREHKRNWWHAHKQKRKAKTRNRSGRQ